MKHNLKICIVTFYKNLLLSSILLLSCFIHTIAPAKAAITYTLNGGRLGNNFLSYMHAKWISYHFDIPLLYVPFPFSDQLALHDIEQHFSPTQASQKFSKSVTFKRGDPLHIDRNSSTLYILPYFPECVFEVESPNGSAFYFQVPWDDAGFKEELRKCMQPKNQLSLIQRPDNAIAVAVHVRKSCNGLDSVLSYDFPDGIFTPNHEFRDISFPYCLPPDAYYIEQIKNLANLFDDQPLYIYILSDDKNVDKIMEKYCQAVNRPNLRFFSRPSGKNSHDINILEDFFFMVQCDCLIRSESTYAVTASKLGDYLVQITPTHHKWHEGHLFMDEAKIIMRKNPITTKYVWIWPHTCSWCRCKTL